MSIVAISDTLGSLADDIGRELARTPGWECADREIITKASQQYGESVLDLAHVTEEKPTLWERFTDSTRHYLGAVESTILEMAARDDVILTGRGAAILLTGVPHALRVRITAPERMRAQRVEQRQGLTHEAAFDLVRHSDRERGARVRFLYRVDWDDPLLYDLVINTDRLTVERAVRLLRETLADPRFATTPESRREIGDRALVAQVKAALAVDPRTRGARVYPTAREGHLGISGMVEREEQRLAVEEIVRRLPGVASVHNEIVVTRPLRTYAV